MNAIDPVVLGVSVVVAVLMIIALVSVRRSAKASRRDTALLTARLDVIASRLERQTADLARLTDSRPPASEVAFVVNPTRAGGVAGLHRTANRVCLELGLGTPLWLETTADDWGYGQGLAAVEAGARRVVVVGGDGTVRQVAAALAGTGVDMGIVPSGTGNLLARDLGIPLGRPGASLVDALTGPVRPIDVGWLRWGPTRAQAEGASAEIFLILAGYGFDADIMTDTDNGLKKRIGWLAYVFAGFKHLAGRSARVSVTSDGITKSDISARTVLIGNFGKLMGGLDLMPGAAVDDGRLGAMALTWRGVAGAGTIVAAILHPSNPIMRYVRNVERFQGESIVVGADRELPVQLDGDAVGSARWLIGNVDASALRVRVPSAFA